MEDKTNCKQGSGISANDSEGDGGWKLVPMSGPNWLKHRKRDRILQEARALREDLRLEEQRLHHFDTVKRYIEEVRRPGTEIKKRPIFGLGRKLKPIPWYLPPRVYGEKDDWGIFVKRDRRISFDIATDGFVLLAEGDLVKRQSFTKIREPLLPFMSGDIEDWQQYFDSQGYLYLRAFSDYFLDVAYKPVIRRDRLSYSRLEHLTRNKVRQAICEELKLTHREYIELFHLDDKNRDREFRDMIFPLRYVYGSVEHYLSTPRQRLLWNKLFKALFYSGIVADDGTTMIKSWRDNPWAFQLRSSGCDMSRMLQFSWPEKHVPGEDEAIWVDIAEMENDSEKDDNSDEDDDSDY
ncbi:hypothetical protein BJ508DRAFT_329930 [Ascobolus immersus RN42]|uniref:Uncharacterized protein n=1 Tax=Ascobolus immersus RN42 TaxID=1160509 RepID=A0A3N4HZ70_ASCIM|nr:hypothetical protein BJ508DRAFT_329930 [Ascobolus immersus RN42]